MLRSIKDMAVKMRGYTIIVVLACLFAAAVIFLHATLYLDSPTGAGSAAPLEEVGVIAPGGEPGSGGGSGDNGETSLPVITPGNGGGGGVVDPDPETCSKEWKCISWGDCIGGIQQRKCTCDCERSTDCGTAPSETRKCECESNSDCSERECFAASCENYECMYKPESGTSCDDGDYCTTDDSCENGTCISGEFTCECRVDGDCDTLACKIASCAGNKCQYARAQNGTDCDDDNSCTSDDACKDGECTGRNICECERDGDCDDHDESTRDSCVRNVCVYTRIGSDEEENRTAALVDGTQAEESVVAYGQENISVQISVYPDMSIYSLGKTIKRVTVTVIGKNGSIEGASVIGSIDGTRAKNLTFSEAGEGMYTADPDYGLLEDERRVLAIKVKAFAKNQSIERIKYLLLDKPAEFLLLINRPESNEGVAPGQNVLFEGEIGAGDENKLSDLKMFLIDERSDGIFDMGAEGHTYTRYLTIPKNIDETAYFLVLAKAMVEGNETENAERISLKRKPSLYLYFEPGKEDTKRGDFGLLVKYVDEAGQGITDKVVVANITGYPSNSVQKVLLVREGDFFSGRYTKEKGDNSAKIEVWDVYGNYGTERIPPEFFEEVGSFDAPWGTIILAIILAGAAVVGFMAVRGLSSKRSAAKGEKRKLEEERKELEGLIKRTKLQFYKRQITDEVANKQISEYEERLKSIAQKLSDKS